MIKLLGIPFDANSSFLRGPALAPPAIRAMEAEGSANSFAEDGSEILAGKSHADLGDMVFHDHDPHKAYLAIKERVLRELVPGDKLLSIGGDHSISFPVIEAHAEKYRGLHVLHLDAHADLYDNFDDNPYSHASPFARLMEKGILGSLTQVGIRTLTTHQRAQVTRFGVNVVEMKDFSLGFLDQLQSPLYVSLDMDVLDPAYAPGVSHHEPGGMPMRALLHIIQTISIPIVGADLVEYNPVRDLHHMTAMVGYKLLKELIAKMRG
jgi:agmatinase